MWDIEIYEQTYVQACQPEVCKNLGEVDALKSLYGLNFDQYSTVNYQVRSIGAADSFPQIDQGNWDLTQHVEE